MLEDPAASNLEADDLKKKFEEKETELQTMQMCLKGLKLRFEEVENSETNFEKMLRELGSACEKLANLLERISQNFKLFRGFQTAGAHPILAPKDSNRLVDPGPK